MSEKTQRVHIDDAMAEDIAGGNVQYVCTETERYCWGVHNPDKKYGYYSKSAMKDFIAANYDYYGEGGIFQAMIDAGICFEM